MCIRDRGMSDGGRRRCRTWSGLCKTLLNEGEPLCVTIRYLTALQIPNSGGPNSRARTLGIPENEFRRTNSVKRTQETQLRRSYSGERTRTTNSNAFGLLRISYGDEHKRSGTPGNKATEQNERTGPKPHIKGGLAKQPPNSLSALRERLLQIPQETKETSGTLFKPN